MIKATGGFRVKKTCWSYLIDSIVAESMPLTKCQNFTLLRSYRRSNRPLEPYSNLRGYPRQPYTPFGYKNWNIETNTSKFCTKVHFNRPPRTKNSDMDSFFQFLLILTNLPYLTYFVVTKRKIPYYARRKVSPNKSKSVAKWNTSEPTKETSHLDQ